MAFPSINAILQYFDNSGNVLSGGLLYTYAPGTVTPKTTYTDENLSVANANPIVLDSAGRCVIFLTDGEEYKFVLQTSAGVVVKTIDEVKSPSAIAQANVGAVLFPRTAAEIAASVTPTNYAYPAYNAFRYMSDAQRSDVENRTLLVAVHQPLQDCLNCAIQAQSEAVWPSGSYLITTGLTGGTSISIVGAPRDATLLYYNGATTLSGGMLKFANKNAYAVKSIGFRCGRVQAGNATVQLHCEDSVNVDITDCTFGGGGITSTSNEITGILCDQTASGFVPPRGNIHLNNILYVFETAANGASGSYGIRIKGHASQSMTNLVMDGEGNVEHAFFGISIENCNSSSLGAWLIRGCASAEIRLINSSANTIYGTQVIPLLTTGTGISIDVTSADNLLLAIGFNFSSGAPLAALVDNGIRTTFWPPGAPGGGLNQQGKFQGPITHGKADGTGPHLQIVKSATDTTVSGLEILKSGEAMAAPAFFGIDVGTGIGAMDIERIENGSTTYERVNNDGRRFLYALPTDPGAGAMTASQITFYLDEGGNNLKVRALYADGSTSKIGTIAIV